MVEGYGQTENVAVATVQVQGEGESGKMELLISNIQSISELQML